MRPHVLRFVPADLLRPDAAVSAWLSIGPIKIGRRVRGISVSIGPRRGAGIYLATDQEAAATISGRATGKLPAGLLAAPLTYRPARNGHRTGGPR